ncbi:MAG TPA: PQQ-dependent sugar dehydrogenase, partial [Candidatus Polarisedimenticolaceae bacterium]|nr:PQQ-dependent sugar dehydrogenase [Candidatus Polarisedimenticolaceae bacterium]
MRNGGWARCGLWGALVLAPAAGQSLVDPNLRVDPVVSGLPALTTLAFIGDDDFLLLQKDDGRVRRIRNGVLLPAPVLDLAVDRFGERGLLGIATGPDFPHDGAVYLYYTASSTGADTAGEADPVTNRIERYSWDGAALVAPRPLLTLPAVGSSHHGGILVFGRDDRLFAVIGDQFRQGQLQNYPGGAAPDDTGVIFRLDTHGAAAPGHPLAALRRYYAYGVRNSFGLAVDPLSGTLWQSENGPDRNDELNRVPPGFNGGWAQILGPDADDPHGVGELWMTSGASYVDPQFTWRGTIVPTGLAFVRGRRLGCALEHRLVAASAACGRLYAFALDPARQALAFSSPELSDHVADNAGDSCLGEQDEILFGSGFGPITDVKSGPDGRLYVVVLSGAVYRIGPAANLPADADGDGVADACDCAASDPGAAAPPAEIPTLRPSVA